MFLQCPEQAIRSTQRLARECCCQAVCHHYTAPDGDVAWRVEPEEDLCAAFGAPAKMAPRLAPTLENPGGEGKRGRQRPEAGRLDELHIGTGTAVYCLHQCPAQI